MKKKNLFSLLIISSTFALAGGVLSSNLGFNSPKTVMAEGEEETRETETATLVINQELLNWTSKFTSYTMVKVDGTDLTYSTTNTVKSDKGCLVWNYYSKKYGGIYNTVALPGPITSISYEMDSYVANAVYVGTASNPSTNQSAFESGKETGSFTYDKSSNYTYFKIAQTANSGSSYIKSITVKYETPKTDPVTDLSINIDITSTLDLDVLDIKKVEATILPNTANQSFICSSDNEKIVKVVNNKLVAIAAGKAKITVSTNGTDVDGNKKTISFDVNVTGSPSINKLRNENGDFKSEIDGTTFTLSGVVTSIDAVQKQMTIEDEGRAVLVYGLTSPSNYKVGNKVTVTGSATSFYGLIEVSNPTDIKVIEESADVPSPTKLVNADTSSLLGLDSIIFEATGKIGSVPTFSSSKDTAISLTLTNGKKINVFSKKSLASTIGTSLTAYLNKVGTKGTVTFTLPLGWHDGPQLSMLPDMSVVSSTDVDAVDKFVTDFMHPEVNTTDTGTGKCVSENWYSLAKEAYDALTTDQKAMFDTCTGYKAMKARFDAWAKANPSQTGLNNLFYNDNNNNLAIYVGAGLALTSVAAMALLIINKKKKHSK